MTIKEPTGRLMRWSIYLQQYDFKILHRAGRIHQNADALSRPPIGMLVRHVLVVTRAKSKEQAKPKEILDKLHEVYDDKDLLHFLKYKKHKNDSDETTKETTLKNYPFFKLREKHVIFQRNLGENLFFTIPFNHERTDIIEKAHSWGHFGQHQQLNEFKWMDSFGVQSLQMLKIL